MHKNELGSYQFDIKETVHLSHQQLPIEEVEEMELIPQIEIAENGGEIEITGSLYLYGDYRGNQKAGKLETADDLPESYEESVQFEPLSANRGPFSPLAREDRFEYRIPVKITLPRGKVREVEDVYAFINSFDYELISPYQIDVRASLVIAGFSERTEEEISPKENRWDDQFEFVHVAGDQSLQATENSFTQRLKEIEQQEKAESKENEEKEAEPRLNATEETPASAEKIQEPEIHEEPSRIPATEGSTQEVQQNTEEEGVSLQAEEKESKVSEELGNVIPLPLSGGETVEEGVEDNEEREDVRVAISTKGTRHDREPISSLSSIFGRAPKPQESVPEEPSPADNRDQEEEEEDKEALYLTNFMENQEEKFTKVRICILQKNETLEEVADRYALSIESILRANKTERNQVGAGQLLYIPVKG